MLFRSNCEWKFKVNNEDFNYIKKLSANHSEDKVFSINVIDGEVVLKQPNKWEIKVDDIQKINKSISFGKKYLRNINIDDDHIQFYMFPTFILIKDKIQIGQIKKTICPETTVFVF